MGADDGNAARCDRETVQWTVSTFLQRSKATVTKSLHPHQKSKFSDLDFLPIAKAMVYHHATACISSKADTVFVSHHTVGVYKKLLQ